MPRQFDPICSDLLNYSIARAVAASSAVPGLLTPIRLRSYAGTCGYQQPAWIEKELAARRTVTRRYMQARIAQSYLDPGASSSIFLMDGGVTDNLGVRGTFERVVERGSLGATLAEAGFGGAHTILLIVANAQTEPDLDLHNKGNFFQSLAMMAGIASGIQIRRFNFETLELVRNSFTGWADRLSASGRPFRIHMVEVSFAQVRDPGERRYLNNLPTSFALDDRAVDGLRGAAREVLQNSEEFQDFLSSLNAENARASRP